MIFESLFLLILIATFSFWIWMIVDCATNEPSTGNDKVVWIIVIVFTHFIGALIYYFVRRRPRLEEWQRRWEFQHPRD
ncbi:MAG: PLD nuclease N-terminal domain-containing protein [Bryobacteraceae bacterium]|jgi:prolipoprotein diacylglyceryltransferase